jgi:heme/copper-type cytochrome/quinol oxidase subunit 2
MVALASGQGAERYEAKWVLVRPDDFVAWTSQEETVSPQTAAWVLAQASANTSPEMLVNKDG